MKKKYVNKFQDAINYYQKGGYQQSLKICELLIQKDGKEEQFFYLLADNLIALGLYQEAASPLLKGVKKWPKSIRFRNTLAGVLLKLGGIADALRQYRQLVKLEPENSNYWSLLSGCAGPLGYYDEAMSAALKAVAISPDNLSANMNLATAYYAVNLSDKACKHYKICAGLEPKHPVIQCKLGDAYTASGDRKEAETCYRKSISLNPSYTHPYRQISRLNRYTSPEHDDFRRIHAVLDSSTLPDEQKSNLHFALGKMYEDCALYDKAFKHLEMANVIENRKHNFDPEQFSQIISQLVSFFDKKLFFEKSNLGDPDKRPVFIVGMPRSGSTLIEHIISTHPQAFGAGELYWFGQIEHKIADLLESPGLYPDCVRDLDKKALQKLAADYLAYISSLAGGEGYECFTDKLLGNFMHIGIIALIFPNARIIHSRRNPLDNCFSIYSILFPGNVDFGHDLHNIAVVYNEYTRLMQHWETVLPDRILTVDYEDIVNKQGETTRQLIDFIGLTWHDECLDFSYNKRQVNTISASQVRKGLYSSSINRWENFEKYLAPLFKHLDPEILQRVNANL